MNERIYAWMDGWMLPWLDGKVVCMPEWMEVFDKWIGVWINGWKDVWMVWMDASMVGWINRWKEDCLYASSDEWMCLVGWKH